ncbi:unnamed protein product (macronuclear) [Paramecium tetraurelia]|uniref:Uncharacterized protein n=1 Tax=Paramecium tetraurelia TaxID=5888 RepID=A0E7Y5_PARTE|nr:uncharacterized protein GSPATT00024130001 [Paramecium tetraurelia]CAK91402.1 unnamed protein product [Paramecium tetraurelia]|eukprot:XP_001458799.1 hypothetical protein (macronuclear) [Paramecium tetraurelia strain d4-2]
MITSEDRISTILNVGLKEQLAKFKNQSFRKRQLFKEPELRRKSTDYWLASDKEKRLDLFMPTDEHEELNKKLLLRCNTKTLVVKRAKGLIRNEVKSKSFQSINNTVQNKIFYMKKSAQHLDKLADFETPSKKVNGFENMIKSKNYEIYIRGRTNCMIRNYINEIFNCDQKPDVNISKRIQTLPNTQIKKYKHPLDRNEQILRTYNSKQNDIILKSLRF